MENQNKIASFKDLNAWKEGHRLAIETYRITTSFPKSEAFRLTNQIRRAVVSITSNIAEGFSRQSAREKIQFYSISMGSLTEVQSQLQIALDIGYLEQPDFDQLDERSVIVSKLINGLLKYLRSEHNT